VSKVTPGRLIAACVVLAYLDASIGRDWVGSLISNGTGVLVAGVAVLAARRRPGWMVGKLLAGGLVATALGDISYTIVVGVGGGTTVSIADALYLAYYLLMAAGIVTLIRSRASQDDSGVMGDGATIAVASALVAWQFLVGGAQSTSSLALLDRVVLAAYPLADVVLVAGLAWLLLAPGRRSPALWLLVAHFGAMLVADVVFALRGDGGTLGAYLVDPLYSIGYALGAGALIHPSAATLAQPEPQQRDTLHPARIAFLGVALFTAPIVAVIEHERGRGVNSAVLLGVSAALAALVLIRMRSLVRHTKVAEATLAHQATHDALTGLPNRPLLLDRLGLALAHADRRPGQTCVMYLDVDRFKIVNDSLGHAAGDHLLVEVARRLERCGRAGDTVARLGGDEFVLLCEDVAGVEEATRIAERVIEALGTPVPILDEVAHVSASVGIALHAGPGTGDTPESMLRDADAAMYRAKGAGKGRWELFDSELRAVLDRRLSTEHALRLAVEREELRLLFQPQVDVRSGEIVGCEALVRWDRPGHGMMPPDQFISIAEEAALISDIGAWVLERSCRQLARWNDTRPDRHPMSVSVNVSSRQIVQRGFAGLVGDIVARTGIDPTCLILEITESALVTDPPQVLARLETLRSIGVQLSIDDFGTGYSSLEYLRRYPLDEVKIAPVFVTEVTRLGADATIAAAVIALARALGYRSTAEGVETDAQLAALAALGCDRAQGYLFARPLSAAEVDGLIAARATAITV
jgi:diguanylate cyclase